MNGTPIPHFALELRFKKNTTQSELRFSITNHAKIKNRFHRYENTIFQKENLTN